MIIQSDLSNCLHLERCTDHAAQRVCARSIPPTGVMWMDADGAEDLRMLLRQSNALPGFFERIGNGHHGINAVLLCTQEHCTKIRRELPVGEVTM